MEEDGLLDLNGAFTPLKQNEGSIQPKKKRQKLKKGEKRDSQDPETVSLC